MWHRTPALCCNCSRSKATTPIGTSETSSDTKWGATDAPRYAETAAAPTTTSPAAAALAPSAAAGAGGYPAAGATAVTPAAGAAAEPAAAGTTTAAPVTSGIAAESGTGVAVERVVVAGGGTVAAAPAGAALHDVLGQVSLACAP